jgi:hypothetical protein
MVRHDQGPTVQVVTSGLPEVTSWFLRGCRSQVYPTYPSHPPEIKKSVSTLMHPQAPSTLCSRVPSYPNMPSPPLRVPAGCGAPTFRSPWSGRVDTSRPTAHFSTHRVPRMSRKTSVHERLAVGACHLALSLSIAHCVHAAPTAKAVGSRPRSCVTKTDRLNRSRHVRDHRRLSAPQLTQICYLAPRSIQAGRSVRSEQACITTSDKIPGGQSSILDFRG